MGFSLIEWSKLHMYRAYATLKDCFGLAIRLLYINTDSFIIHVKCNDLYKEILDVRVLSEMMDLSEVFANHPSGVSDPTCPKTNILGKFNVLCHGIF